MSGTAPVENGGAAPSEDRGPNLAALGPRRYLQAAGEVDDESLDVAYAALACAALDHPERDLGPYLDHLEQLAASAKAATSAAASVEMQAQAVLEVMGRTYGYRGDDETYDDAIGASMDAALDLTGEDVGTPLIAFDDTDGERVGLFGPVMSNVPTGDAAVEA